MFMMGIFNVYYAVYGNKRIPERKQVVVYKKQTLVAFKYVDVCEH